MRKKKMGAGLSRRGHARAFSFSTLPLSLFLPFGFSGPVPHAPQHARHPTRSGQPVSHTMS